MIRVSVKDQSLYCLEDDKLVARYAVSTAKNGVGEQMGSEKTPRGWHQVRAKIGADMPVNTVFVARRPTGEVYSAELGRAQPDRDWILTRILWLSGLEPGFNRYGDRDSMRRFIYIHGTPDTEPMGVSGSHGCIRMHNQGLIELFAWAAIGTKIFID